MASDRMGVPSPNPMFPRRTRRSTRSLFASSAVVPNTRPVRRSVSTATSSKRLFEYRHRVSHRPDGTEAPKMTDGFDVRDSVVFGRVPSPRYTSAFGIESQPDLSGAISALASLVPGLGRTTTSLPPPCVFHRTVTGRPGGGTRRSCRRMPVQSVFANDNIPTQGHRLEGHPLQRRMNRSRRPMAPARKPRSRINDVIWIQRAIFGSSICGSIGAKTCVSSGSEFYPDI